MKTINPMPMRATATAIPAIAPLLNPLFEEAKIAGEDGAEG